MKRALSKTLPDKDSKGKVVGSTRQTKDRKYHYNSNGTSAGSETKRNQNGTRIIKDASGRVKYTVRENGQQEVIKDSKGHIAGTTRTTKDRKYYYDSNGSSAGSETRW